MEFSNLEVIGNLKEQLQWSGGHNSLIRESLNENERWESETEYRYLLLRTFV